MDTALKPAVLVTGGAGYIGAHTAKALHEQGFTPVVYDSLSSGFQDAVRWGPFVRGEARSHEIARLSQLAFVRDVDPQPAENPLLFEREHVGVRVGAAMDIVRAHQCPDVVAVQRLVGRGGPSQSSPVRGPSAS